MALALTTDPPNKGSKTSRASSAKVYRKGEGGKRKLRSAYEKALEASGVPRTDTSRKHAVRQSGAEENGDLNGNVTRTPMGDYVPPRGTQPLTSLSFELPSPASYAPRVGMSYQPGLQYSIRGRHEFNEGTDGPGPLAYNVREDLADSKVRMSFGMRHQTSFAMPTPSPGPGAYTVPMQRDPRAASMSGRHAWIAPDYPGPGSYDPPACIGPPMMRSLGVRLHDDLEDVRASYPGPTDYSVDFCAVTERMPAFSLGKRTEPIQKDAIGPGPGAYMLPSSMVRKPMASVSLKGRHTDNTKEFGPGPQSYEHACPSAKGLAFSMTDRNQVDFDLHHPGPCDYFPDLAPVSKTAPQFTMSSRTVITSNPLAPPSSSDDFPGPGHYAPMSKPCTPAFSMTARRYTKESRLPGPADYCVSLPKSAPAFSIGMRMRPHTADAAASAGPADYFPKLQRKAPAYSLSSRLKDQPMADNPAPNAYLPQPTKGKKGPSFSLRSRASPFVYSGIHSSGKLSSLLDVG